MSPQPDILALVAQWQQAKRARAAVEQSVTDDYGVFLKRRKVANDAVRVAEAALLAVEIAPASDGPSGPQNVLAGDPAHSVSPPEG